MRGFFINVLIFSILDVCTGYCENNGKCVKDIRGQPSCRCVGSFIGPQCKDKSEFAYIAGGIAATVIFLIIIALFIWMICARYVKNSLVYLLNYFGMNNYYM